MNAETRSAAAIFKKPRRRWLQYSLRTLLVATILAAVAAAWLGAECRKGQRQQEAIAWVEKMGGSIEYDQEASHRDWRRRIFGDRFPERVVAVDMRTSYDKREIFYLVEHPIELDDSVSDIASLAALEDSIRLDLAGTQVSDLSPLANMKHLEELYLDFSPVADLTPLSDCKNLRILSLVKTEVADVTSLAGLERLEHLDLRSTYLTDLSPLSALSNLERLELGRAAIDFPAVGYCGLVRANEQQREEEALPYGNLVDVAPLATLRNLRILSLRGTQVSDLTAISGLESLVSLDIAGSRVDDLSQIVALQQLTWLDVSDTEIREISSLSSLLHLESLTTSRTRVTDLTPLTNLERLRYLLMMGLDEVSVDQVTRLQ